MSITRIVLMVMVSWLVMGQAAPAQAQSAPATSEVCTNIQANKQQAFQPQAGTSVNSGLLSQIYIFIKEVVGQATKKLFTAFTDSAKYQSAVTAAIVLMIVFYGVGFTIGVVQLTFAQLISRGIKLGLIATLISPGGWIFFSDYAVKFFMDGTDELVKGVMQIGTNVQIPAGATPFYHLDRIADYLVKPDTIIAVMGSIGAGGPFGLAVGGLLAIACWSFVMLLIDALKIYAVTFVGRSLLLGVAPIFIVFLLFERTRQMFISWVNALLSMALQPILLFTLLSFFIVLIESAASDMLKIELCWTEFANISGSTDNWSFWRFKDDTGLMTSPLTYKGSLQCILTGTENGKERPSFPINIVDILSFMILVYLARRFGSVVERVSSELSSAFISLDAGGKIDQFMSQAGQSLGGGAKPKAK